MASAKTAQKGRANVIAVASDANLQLLLARMKPMVTSIVLFEHAATTALSINVMKWLTFTRIPATFIAKSP